VRASVVVDQCLLLRGATGQPEQPSLRRDQWIHLRCRQARDIPENLEHGQGILDDRPVLDLELRALPVLHRPFRARFAIRVDQRSQAGIGHRLRIGVDRIEAPRRGLGRRIFRRHLRVAEPDLAMPELRLGLWADVGSLSVVQARRAADSKDDHKRRACKPTLVQVQGKSEHLHRFLPSTLCCLGKSHNASAQPHRYPERLESSWMSSPGWR